MSESSDSETGPETLLDNYANKCPNPDQTQTLPQASNDENISTTNNSVHQLHDNESVSDAPAETSTDFVEKSRSDLSVNKDHVYRNESIHLAANESSQSAQFMSVDVETSLPVAHVQITDGIERNVEIESTTQGLEMSSFDDVSLRTSRQNDKNYVPNSIKDANDKNMDVESSESENVVIVEDQEVTPVESSLSQQNQEYALPITLKTENGIESFEKSTILNDKEHVIESNGNDEFSPVQVKQEPLKMMEYEKAAISMYRNQGPLVIYSDTDDNSGNDNNVVPNEVPEQLHYDGGSENEVVSDDEDKYLQKQRALQILMIKKRSRTEGEIFPEELPPLEYLTLSPDETVKLQPLGVVSGIVEVLVIVKADLNTPALYDDTVLFSETRAPLGLVFEVFGTVEQPFYSVRFNSKEDIKEKDIKVGDPIMFAPSADNLTKFIFIKELRSRKYDDASWENDNEPPAERRDFSDDEEEKRAKAKGRRGGKKGLLDESTGLWRLKRRRMPEHRANANNGAPFLLKGDLRKNPFGDRSRPFNFSGSQWPPSGHRLKAPQMPPPQRFSSSPFPPRPAFGERPKWEHQQFRSQGFDFMNRFGGPPMAPHCPPDMRGQMFRGPPPFSFPSPGPGQCPPPPPSLPPPFPPPLPPPPHMPGPPNISGMGYINGADNRLPFNPSVPPPSFRSVFSSPPPPTPSHSQ
ncbi:H/ACA ribonucleoprotein complex non-core subunit NAF1 [Aplysia californica]|uniref:H/ACA ribonucleoprotein complex non-core subunit NAF1 n=1 Tax=Aplysia californica TaxID=6500 RepID=A0ABM0JTT6_APLCA|nr:H/ACA ribonucleoprotein complex non-core subunit NAF1 [Aplysia californica]XP_005101328.1 H/ACA ribonucleoprotein complex non-core subunit NAF1 [Aplysia californica]